MKTLNVNSRFKFMRKLQYIFSALLITSVVNAQDKPLGTEVINVVKPYTPSIADAFKLRELPSISDSIILTKKKIKYTIFLFQWLQHLRQQRELLLQYGKDLKNNFIIRMHLWGRKLIQM